MTAVISFKAIRNGVQPPEKSSPRASGYDLRGAISYTHYIAPGDIITIPCGFVLAIPNGFEGQIRGRREIARMGILLAEGVGTISPDYRGEVKVLLYNSTRLAYPIHPRDRIAQLVIAPRMDARFIEQAPSQKRDRDA